MNETPDNPPFNASGSKAFRNAAIVVVILLLFSPLRLIALPFLAAAAFVWLLRRLWRLNRALGMTTTALVVLSISVYAILFYLADQKDRQLFAELAQYRNVRVARDFFPLPHPAQLSVKAGVDDEQLAAILKQERLASIYDISLKNGRLTDACLQDVAAMPNLTRVFLDCDGISNEAIIALEQQLPNCQVLAFQRDLYPDSSSPILMLPSRD
ncbi:hypothetical protein [Blastopirellula marina]|uniref:Uncharacterized protein n=1 Tax=Blastopirellula marina TaxID=124 RepID=A0A2S8GL04_9BACT|nr:hypothetical protein [Blastopirellula marina]PQO45129.1 hypothetical protein C5Y93_16485 [Blastopirellula marina]